MADIIYTGKGAAQALQGGGQSLQALGQFSAQQQQTKRDELSKAIKDQDTFLNMLKTDPVYTASQKANKEIANGMEGYVGKWGDIYRQKGGQLSTSDLADMQADKGALVAKMNHFKESNDQVLKASMEFQRNRDKYDPEEFYEALAEYESTGFIPEGGLLQPAYVDPRTILSEYSALTPQLITRPMLDKNGKPMVNEFGHTITEKIMSYIDPETGEPISDEQRRDVALNLYRENSEVKYQALKMFNSLPVDSQEGYAKMAIDQGYKSPAEAMIAELGPRFVYQDYTKQSQIRSTSSSRDDDDSFKLRKSGSKTYYGVKGKPLFFQETIDEEGLTEGDGISFKQSNIKSFSVPVAPLRLPDDIIPPEDGAVDILPMAADKNDMIKLKIESDLNQRIVSEKKPTGRVDNEEKPEIIFEKITDDGRTVRISKEEYNKLPEGSRFGTRSNYKDQYQIKTIYTYTKPVEDKIVVTNVGNISSYMSNVIPDFANVMNDLLDSNRTSIMETPKKPTTRESKSESISVDKSKYDQYFIE